MHNHAHAHFHSPSPSPSPLGHAQPHILPRVVEPYTDQNQTYIEEYTRGLLGVHLTLDLFLSRILWSIIGLLAVVLLTARVSRAAHAHLRLLTTADTPLHRQRYWGLETSKVWSWTKKHILYAPLKGKRHNREIMLSKAVNVGVIPSRFHTFLITTYILIQIAYCCILSYSANHRSAILAELRGRSGSLSLINMVPLIIFAGRNNPLIKLLGVSFDTYNLFHRWLGRISAVEAIVHTLVWAAAAVHAGGWHNMLWRCFNEGFFLYGTIGTIGMLVLLCHSPSPIRHAFYETFLGVHQCCAILTVVVVWIHLKIDALPQCSWYPFIPAFWLAERSLRLVRLLYLNVSRKHGATRVTVEALPGEASRVTFHLPGVKRIPAGSHVYAYFPRFSLWMNHPFSVAWAESDTGGPDALAQGTAENPVAAANPVPAPMPSRSMTVKANQRLGERGRRRFDAAQNPEKLSNYSGTTATVADTTDSAAHPTTRVSLVIAARTGLTRRLYNAALSRPNATLHTRGFLEGPYAASHPSSFASYGTVLLFSGGAGITHHMLHARDLLAAIGAGRASTRRIYLIWTVRTTECFAWVTPFMNAVLAMPDRKRYLTTKLFVSKPRNPAEIRNLSQSVQMFPGRCKPGILLDEVLDEAVVGGVDGGTGAVGVSVCGPGAFADEVRGAVRGRIGQGVVLDFVEESFSW